MHFELETEGGEHVVYGCAESSTAGNAILRAIQDEAKKTRRARSVTQRSGKVRIRTRDRKEQVAVAAYLCYFFCDDWQTPTIIHDNV
jgi:hypothetical protein